MAARVSQRTKPIRTGIAAAAGCLAEFLFWWYVVPFAIVLVYIAVFDPTLFGLVTISPVVFYGVIIVIVVAVLVVLLTTTIGYLRAKQAAVERELRDGDDPPTSGRSG